MKYSFKLFFLCTTFGAFSSPAKGSLYKNLFNGGETRNKDPSSNHSASIPTIRGSFKLETDLDEQAATPLGLENESRGLNEAHEKYSCSPTVMTDEEICNVGGTVMMCEAGTNACWIVQCPVSEGPTKGPTSSPSASPTKSPTTSPSKGPTAGPSSSPTPNPTNSPTKSPTASPSTSPTSKPTSPPTAGPTTSPSSSPTKKPTLSPTNSPTGSPSASPTGKPTNGPTASPTSSPNALPTTSPTSSPTNKPTSPPSSSPTTSPVTPPTASPSQSFTTTSLCLNRVLNGGFESGLENWFGFGSVTMAEDTETFNYGTASCLVTNRNSGTWMGIAQEFLGVLNAGESYRVSAWIKLRNSVSDNIRLSFRVEFEDGSLTYPGVFAAVTDQWTHVEGIINFPAGVYARLTLYIEKPAIGVEYWVDDVMIAPATCETVLTPSPTSTPTTSPTSSPTPLPTAPSSPQSTINAQVDVTFTPNANSVMTAILPPSTANELLTLNLFSLDNEYDVPVARSYDGLDWETLHPLLLDVNCVSGSCSIQIPSNADVPVQHYIIYDYAPEILTNDEAFAKLLLQGTYGPTTESLSDAVALGSAVNWVQSQMDESITPPSLLRAHYRQRTNAYMKTDLLYHGTRLACENGSRWQKHAFNRWRDIGKTVTEVPAGASSFYLTIDGIARTEVSAPPSSENATLTSTYVICRPERNPADASMRFSDFTVAPTGQRGKLLVAPTSDDCMDMHKMVKVDMPSVHFSDEAAALGYSVPSANLVSPSDPNILEAKILQDPAVNCADFKRTWPNFVKDSSSGLYYLEDRRVELYENTDGTGPTKKRLLQNRCPRVPRTFLNEDSCVPRPDCGAPVFSGQFELNDENLRKFYEIDQKYVYKLDNLPVVGTQNPCSTNDNRFVRKSSGDDASGCSGATGNSQFPGIVTAIEEHLLGLSPATQDSIRVIDFDNVDFGCTDANGDSLEASFTINLPSGGQSCWTHSYYREFGVFVFNDWVANHDGNPRFFRESKPNPIAYPAEHENTSGNLEESVTLEFPSFGFHQWNFHNNRWRFDSHFIGNYGDTIFFNDLPDSAKSVDVVLALGGTLVAASGKVVEVCGSPGEVANDPMLGNQYLLQKYGDAEEEWSTSLDQDHERWYSNHLVWNTVSLNAKDQLRQRTAWALSSIFVVTENDISRDGDVENWSNYYDIFVRHAFGNFFDILKEVSFNPLMGEMLTYEGSKSLSFQVENNGVLLYPDENFAREIMQLFSIGLFMLNQDGTLLLDEVTGEPVETYTNEDIMNFARGWTNFARQEGSRDNVEPEWNLNGIGNLVDPMFLPTSEGRDLFPKQTLNVNGIQGHIGDKVQRCDAMPNRPWLRKGATYQFRSTSQSEMGKKDPDWWSTPHTWAPFMALDPTTSALYAKLCNADAVTGECQFRSTVILDEDIPCDGTCTAKRAVWDQGGIDFPCECSIDEPRTVRIDHSPTSAPIWYEYVRAPCVQMAFPEVGALNALREIGQSDYGNKAMCADNRMPVGGTACCDANGQNPFNICVFKGERTTFESAVDRCEAYGRQMCAWDNVPISWDCGTDMAYGQGSYSENSSPGLRFTWTAEPCSMSAQIDQDGKVAIIHTVGSIEVKERVGIDTGTYFGVFWDGSYPTVDNNNCGSCAVQASSNTCVCSASVSTIQVFYQLPVLDDIMSQLHIGSPDPASFDGNYTMCSAPSCTSQEYNVYFTTPVSVDGSVSGAFDESTIFEVQDPVTGDQMYLSNTLSVVNVGDGLSFRNPPMFNSPVDPTQRDGLYETDEILKGYFNHPNTPPFISMGLIRHLITSNPSPRYVKVVADAFSSGTYVNDGQTFGSGKRGDLAATIAAIMLDSEARSSTLDDDANHGRAREPLLKIMHMFRSMELATESRTPREVDMVMLTDRGLGQESFNAPSVFSFFLSEYQPVGPVFSKGLVAPETQLFDAPKLISYVNGLFAVPEYGMSDCPGYQLGLSDSKTRYMLPDYPDAGEFSCNDAEAGVHDVQLQFRYVPPSWGSPTSNVNNAQSSAIIQDMDLLLTGGRLHANSRTFLEQLYDNVFAESGSDMAALKAVVSHFAVAPEFHITNNLVDSRSTTTIRDTPDISLPETPVPVTGYKAIVYMFLAGAMDSYSALVPTNCALHTQYLSVRGDVAIQSGLRSITTAAQHGCSFALHPSLAKLQGLFNNGDASYVANIGPLVSPMDKYQFEAGSVPQPQALFAHNTQTQVTQAVFAQDSSAGGVLGRIGDAINDQEGTAVFDAYSISGTPKVLEGAPGVSKPADVLSGYGVSSFAGSANDYEVNIEILSQNVVTSIYGETYSASMTNSIYRTRLLKDIVGNEPLTYDTCFTGVGGIALQFQQVAKIIKNRDDLEAKRDVFYVQDGGYDTHSDNGPKLTELLNRVDGAIGCFADEMKAQSVWNNVTIVSASEFGRTLTSNGQGTDHAWGGNHFIAGGSVKGGLIHGQYPDDLSDDGILNIGRGRLIPTTPWEGLWKGVAEWFGVDSAHMSSVLPNLPNFASNIFDEVDLFDG